MKKVASVLLLILFAIPIPLALLAGGMLTVAFYAVLLEFGNTGLVGIALVILLLLLAASYIVTYGFACFKTWEKSGNSIYVLLPCVHILVVVLYALLLNPIADFLGVSSSCFGLRVKDYTVVESLDTHGGFHGDGSYYYILDCSQNSEKALEIVSSGWNKLPLPKNIEVLMFGHENSWYRLADEAKMPKVENGYYVFVNRSPGSEASDWYGNITNFTIAVYDTDTDTVYYFENDT